MREAANILDIIRHKRRLTDRDRAFLEAVTDALDEAADARTVATAEAVMDALDMNMQRAADAYNTTKED